MTTPTPSLKVSASVTLYLNFSPRNNFMVGPFKVRWAAFRQKHLTPSTDYHYNPWISMGKGWLIPKGDPTILLMSALLSEDIDVDLQDCTPKQRAACPTYSQVVTLFKGLHPEQYQQLSGEPLLERIVQFIKENYEPKNINRGSVAKSLGMAPPKRTKAKATKFKASKTIATKSSTIKGKSTTKSKVKVPKSKKSTPTSNHRVRTKAPKKPTNTLEHLIKVLQKSDQPLTYDDILSEMKSCRGRMYGLETRVRNNFNQGLYQGYFLTQLDSEYGSPPRFSVTSRGKAILA